MKRSLDRVAMVACLTVLTTSLMAADLAVPFGVERKRATADVIESFVGGSVSYYSLASQFRSASMPARAAMVEQVLAWTRAYVASSAFAADYARERESAKPAAPAAAASVDDAVKKQDAELEAQIAEMRKSLAAAPAAQRKEMEKAMNDAIASMRAAQKNPEFRNAQRQGLEQSREEEQKGYAQSVEQWKQRYPADPRLLVARRLQTFLDLSATVDYNAQLVSKNGRKAFANPAYEAKPAEWKLCYRAGKEPVEKARAFAATWLRELKAK